MSLMDIKYTGEKEVASEAASKTKVPCEFCNEPCTLEALMRHQVSAESDKIFA